MKARTAVYVSLGVAALSVAMWQFRWLPLSFPNPVWLAGATDDARLEGRITLPAGYRISIFADKLDGVRVMQFAPGGGIYVSVPGAGEIRLVAGAGAGARSKDTATVARRLRKPHGLAADGTVLYVAEEQQITAFDIDPKTGQLANRRVVAGVLPHDGGHSTRTIARGPDGWFYVAVGSSCNVCEEKNPWRAALLRFRPGGRLEVYARGLRNTVGFDWQPGSNALYGVDNGRDWLGDDFPPDELNRIVRGGHYGWPYFNGANKPDPELGTTPAAHAVTPLAPAYAFGAHTAPLSIRFLRNSRDPALKGSALVAQHGSWNRSKKAGYALVSLHWGDDGKITARPFAAGFEIDDQVIGRPVDIIEAADGTIYVSDDFAGRIYRISYDPAAS